MIQSILNLSFENILSIMQKKENMKQIHLQVFLLERIQKNLSDYIGIIGKLLKKYTILVKNIKPDVKWNDNETIFFQMMINWKFL